MMLASEDADSSSFVVKSDPEDDEDEMEDLFGNNLQRFKALKTAANLALQCQSAPQTPHSPCDVTRNTEHNYSSTAGHTQPDTTECDALERILDQLDPDHISPAPKSPLAKKSCCLLDEQCVGWIRQSMPVEQNSTALQDGQHYALSDSDDDVTGVNDPVANQTQPVAQRVLLLVEVGAKSLRIPCGLDEKMRVVCARVSQCVGSCVSRVRLSHNRRVIDPDTDTPSSLGLKQLDCLEYWEMKTVSDVGSSSCPNSNNSNNSNSNDSDGAITLKLQCANRRDTRRLVLPRGMSLAHVISEYCRLQERPARDFRFSFDGQTVSPQDTAESLELEGGECIDVYDVCVK